MISIVIPVHNVENYLYQCLKSIDNQTFRNFEIIIVDDGSTDKSLQIATNFKNNSSSTVYIIHQKNLGVSIARNAGILYSHGNYICFIDADDIVSNNYLLIMYKQIIFFKSDLCICNSLSFNKINEINIRKHKSYNFHSLNKIQMLNKLLYDNFKVGIWCLLIKKTLLNSLKFAENYKYSEDAEMVWKLVAKSNKIVIINSILYFNRIRSGSAMSRVNDERVDGYRLFKMLGAYIKKESKEFYHKYRKYGVAKWVWSTVWQIALISDSYIDFRKRIKKYSPVKYIKRLIFFQNMKISFLSFLFIYFNIVYYYLIRILKLKYRKLEKEEQ